MSEESIKSPNTSDISFPPELVKRSISSKFKRICLKQNSMSFFHKNVINLYISYKLDTWLRDLNTNFTLRNCLFRAVKLIKNYDPDKYGHKGYGIGFDAR